MKKWVAIVTVICLMFTCVAGAFAGDTVISIDLSTATDEEIDNAIALLKAEQIARLKTYIELDHETEFTLNAGAKENIRAEVKDLQEGVQPGKFKWSTSDASVAACNDAGAVTAKGKGKATITCSVVLSDGTELTASCEVNVLVPVKSISAKVKKAKIFVKDTVDPGITLQPADASNPVISWTSSDEQIAVVDENGIITGKGYGHADITARTTDGSDKQLVISVDVNQREGATTEVITFQGIPWGSPAEEVTKLMEEAGVCKVKTILDGGDMWFSPEMNGDKTYDLFWNYHWAYETERQKTKVTGVQKAYNKDVLTKIGGYQPSSVEFTYYYPIVDGDFDRENTSLSIVALCYTYSSTNTKIDTVYSDLKQQLAKTYGKAKDFSKKGFCVWYGEDNTCVMCGLRKSWLETDVFIVYAYTDIAEQEKFITDYIEKWRKGVGNVGV